MADVTIGSLVLNTGEIQSILVYGESVSVGHFLYKTAAKKYEKAKAETDKAEVSAIALVAGVLDGMAIVAKVGAVLTFDAVLTPGVYVLSPTAGKMRPVADLASGDVMTVVGVAISTTQFIFDPITTGVTKP
jgi:hypothetical protein